MPYCNTCKYLDGGSCTRFPRWEPVMPDMHYCGEHKTTGKTVEKKKSPPNPDVKKLMEHYSEEFERIHGATPLINYKVESPLAKQMLEHYPLDECEAIVSEFLSNPPQFYKDKGLRAFRHIISAVKSGQVIDRLDRRRQESRKNLGEQLRIHHDADPDDLFRYEQFIRMTSESMPFEEWRKEFV